MKEKRKRHMHPVGERCRGGFKTKCNRDPCVTKRPSKARMQGTGKRKAPRKKIAAARARRPQRMAPQPMMAMAQGPRRSARLMK